MVEQLTLNQRVVGSSPTRRTKVSLLRRPMGTSGRRPPSRRVVTGVVTDERKRRNGEGSISQYKETRYGAALPMHDGTNRTKVRIISAGRSIARMSGMARCCPVQAQAFGGQCGGDLVDGVAISTQFDDPAPRGVLTRCTLRFWCGGEAKLLGTACVDSAQIRLGPTGHPC